MKKPKRLQDRIVMHLVTWLLASVASLEYNVFIGTMLEKGREQMIKEGYKIDV